MRRVVLLVAGTAVVVAVLVGLRDHGSPADGPRPTAAAPSSTPATSSSPAVYRAGTALGSPVSTDYGVVQVRVTTRGGRIVDVVPVQLPHEVPQDVTLSRRAVEELEPAVLEAQSADVDVVTGSTYTSTGYLQSLQSALDSLR